MIYRKYGTIDITQLRTNNWESDLMISAQSTLDNQVEKYKVCLTSLMDKHAPVGAKMFTEQPITPWHNKCEHLYCQTILTIHKDMYHATRLNLNRLIANSKLS